MSRTESVRHSSEYWRYTAQAMDELLSEAIDTNTYEQTGFHRRLLDAALEFLTIALGKAPGLEDPSASIANFGLAARALRRAGEPSISEADINKQLAEFVSELKALRDQGLHEKSPSALHDLQHFFQQVFAAADSESYSSVVLHHPQKATLYRR